MMHRRPRVMMRTIAALLAVTLAAGHVMAQPEGETAPVPLAEALTGQPRDDYTAGRVLYADGDFGGALLKFEAAHRDSGDPRLLWNMAACEKNLRHYAKVLELIERYKQEGGQLLTEQDRADAERLIDAIKPLVSHLTISANQDGAEVFVDGQNVGTTPLEAPILIDMGEREVRVRKPGYHEFVQKGNVPGGGDVTITAELKEIVHEGKLAVSAGRKGEIYVDGKLVGVGRWEGTLPSGRHRLRVTAKGARPHESDVLIVDDERNEVKVALQPIERPEADSSSSTWLWVASGAVAAVGLGVGGFFLFRPSEEERKPVAGTMPPGTIQLPLGF